jgi:dihydroorotate dehydrogenase electron transfer subunit
MCCGVGVCLTCVVPIRTPDGWEYQRTCTEGPVFDARAVLWEVPDRLPATGREAHAREAG